MDNCSIKMTLFSQAITRNYNESLSYYRHRLSIESPRIDPFSRVSEKSNLFECNLHWIIEMRKYSNHSGWRLSVAHNHSIFHHYPPENFGIRLTMLHDTSRRFTTLHDASRRFTTLHDAPRRFTTIGDDSRRLLATFIATSAALLYELDVCLLR